MDHAAQLTWGSECLMGANDLNSLLAEHRTLLKAYGAIQTRCTQLLDEQALQIQHLEAQLVRLRAANIIRDTALAFSLDKEDALGNATLAVLCFGNESAHAAMARRVVEMVGGHFLRHDGDSEDTALGAAALEASLVAADLVICQTGCLSHGAYWRVQDHCRRTGKQCVLVEQPAIADGVRIYPDHSSALEEPQGVNTLP